MENIKEHPDELRQTFAQHAAAKSSKKKQDNEDNQSEISYPTPTQEKKLNQFNSDEDYSANDEFYDGEIDAVKRSNLTIESMTINGSTPLQTHQTTGKDKSS